MDHQSGVVAEAPTQDAVAPIQEAVERPATRRRHIRSVLIVAVVAAAILAFGLPQLGLWGNPGCGLPFTTCTRVLFIGDSYTYVNDLPTTFADLAWAAGHRVDAVTLATGGESLAGHVADASTETTIDSETWNTIVLQD